MGDSKGFTLVEVLVVSAIVAILAIVAIPTYTGYVTSQKQQAAKGLAQSAAVSANIYYRRNGADPVVSQLNLFFPDANRYVVTVSGGFIFVTDTTSSGSIRDSAAFR